MSARTALTSGIPALIGMVVLSGAWLLMKIETENASLRWACFLGWVMAVVGLVLKGTYDRARSRFDVPNLIGAMGFGICFLSGVAAELGVMNEKFLWKLGSSILIVSILANAVRYAKAV